jgi:hypothetical protein
LGCCFHCKKEAPGLASLGLGAKGEGVGARKRKKKKKKKKDSSNNKYYITSSYSNDALTLGIIPLARGIVRHRSNRPQIVVALRLKAGWW